MGRHGNTVWTVFVTERKLSHFAHRSKVASLVSVELRRIRMHVVQGSGKQAQCRSEECGLFMQHRRI